MSFKGKKTFGPLTHFIISCDINTDKIYVTSSISLHLLKRFCDKELLLNLLHDITVEAEGKKK